MSHVYSFLIFLTSARICFVLASTIAFPRQDDDSMDLSSILKQISKDKEDKNSQEDHMGYPDPMPTYPSYYLDIMKANEDQDFKKLLDNIDDNMKLQDVNTNIDIEPESTFNYRHPAVPFASVFAFLIIVWSIRLIVIGCCSKRHTPTGYWLIIRRSVYLAPKDPTDDSSGVNSEIPYESMPVTPETPEPPPYTPRDAPPPYKPEDKPPTYYTATA